jgi:nucleotide-binding universal stress UspA family protein
MTSHKILVALDRSSQALMVFEQALDIAQKQGSELILFHSIHSQLEGEAIQSVGTIADVDMYGTLHKLYRDRLQKEIDRVQSWFQEYAEKARARMIPVEFTHGIGEPGKKICNLAKSWGADLIVIGRRGYKGISEVLLGSVSNYVLHHAPCSVLVVQGQRSATGMRVEEAMSTTQYSSSKSIVRNEKSGFLEKPDF